MVVLEIASKSGVEKFLGQMKVRRTLWLNLLDRCSILRGDGTRPGETSSLNSLFLFGKIALDGTTSHFLNNLLRESQLSSYLFVHILHGRMSVQLSESETQSVDNGIFILDGGAFKDITLHVTGTVSFFLIPKPEINFAKLTRTIHGFWLKAEGECFAFFKVLDVIEREIAFVEQSQLKCFKYAFVGAAMSEISNRILARSARKTQSDRIREYIDKNYFDRKLTVQDIANEFQISRSHLYRLFSQVGGVQEYIRKRRLEKLYNDLLRNGVKLKTLKAMAYDYGFSGGNALKRYFHDEYGFDPSMR